MCERFKESISGSAMTEFGEVTESLGGTARLLENMGKLVASGKHPPKSRCKPDTPHQAREARVGTEVVEDGINLEVS